jgi:hypothetical protein
VYGRPQKTTDKSIETDRLNAVLEAEHHLYLLKASIWGCHDYKTQNEHRTNVLEALKPLKVMVIEHGS